MIFTPEATTAALSSSPDDYALVVQRTSPSGEVRVRIYPKGDPTDNAVLSRFVAEVKSIIDAREVYFRDNGVDSMEGYRLRRGRGEVDDGWGDIFFIVDGWSGIRAGRGCAPQRPGAGRSRRSSPCRGRGGSTSC